LTKYLEHTEGGPTEDCPACQRGNEMQRKIMDLLMESGLNGRDDLNVALGVVCSLIMTMTKVGEREVSLFESYRYMRDILLPADEAEKNGTDTGFMEIGNQIH
jgi:hypothetical protein